MDDWCKNNGVSRHAYYYWHRRIQDFQENESEKVFVEIPLDSPEKESVSEENGILVKWNDFSFCIQDQGSIPLVADLMQRLVKKC